MVETGTISDTAIRFASGFIGDFDYYYLYDNIDENSDIEEYTLILSDNYDSENNEFVAPVKYIKIYNRPIANGPFHSYSYSIATFQTNSALPTNTESWLVYSNVSDDYSKIVERGVTHEQNVVGFVVVPLCILLCILHVLLQQILRHDG